MDRIQEINQSQQVSLGQEFYECLNAGILFNPTKGISTMYNHPMSASIVIQHWNHAKFLKMLFQSFVEMDTKDIDLQIVISDGGSNQENIDIIKGLMKEFKGTLKIDFVYMDLNDLRDKFNKENPDGTFHSSVFVGNAGLAVATGDIYIVCDSSNIVNKDWLRGLCSPHYNYHKTLLLVKSTGADFTAESTIAMEGKDYNPNFFNYPHTFHKFEAGGGFGWSVKTNVLKEMGGFNHKFMSCGGGDDDVWYRLKLQKCLFIGHELAKGFHRIHNEGYEKNARKPNWAYKKLKDLYINNSNPDIKLEQEFIKPILELKNY